MEARVASLKEDGKGIWIWQSFGRPVLCPHQFFRWGVGSCLGLER